MAGSDDVSNAGTINWQLMNQTEMGSVKGGL